MQSSPDLVVRCVQLDVSEFDSSSEGTHFHPIPHPAQYFFERASAFLSQAAMPKVVDPLTRAAITDPYNVLAAITQFVASIEQ